SKALRISAALNLLTETLHALRHPEQCQEPSPCSRAFFLSTLTQPGFEAGRPQHTLVYVLTGPRLTATGLGRLAFTRNFCANLLLPLVRDVEPVLFPFLWVEFDRKFPAPSC